MILCVDFVCFLTDSEMAECCQNITLPGHIILYTASSDVVNENDVCQ